MPVCDTREANNIMEADNIMEGPPPHLNEGQQLVPLLPHLRVEPAARLEQPALGGVIR